MPNLCHVTKKKKDGNQVYLYKFLWILFESCNGLKNLHLSKTKKCISGKISHIKQASDFRQTHESHTCWFTHFLCLTWYHPTTFHLKKKKKKLIQGHWSQWKQFYYFRNFLVWNTKKQTMFNVEQSRPSHNPNNLLPIPSSSSGFNQSLSKTPIS